MERNQVACQKHWVLKSVLSKQCTWRRCCGNLETPLVRKLLTFFTYQHIAAFGHGHCMMWPLILVLHGPCPWHGHQFYWSWCHWSWCPWSGAWSWPPCSWWPGGGHGPQNCGPISMKDRTHGLPHLVQVALSWVLLHHQMALQCCAHRWLLGSHNLDKSMAAGGPGLLGLELHGLAPGLLALGVLPLAKHFPWLSVLVVGMVLESTQQCWLGTKIGFCETSFAT